MFAPISVVIPVYNRPSIILRALNSVINQSLKPAEIIIVDDGSTDPLPSFNSDIIVIQQKHHGVSHARNTGAQRAQYPWIAFLDSDDAWMPKKLEIQWNELERRKKPRTAGVHAHEIWVRNGRRVNPKNIHRLYEGQFFPYALKRCIVSPSGILISKSILHENGGFSTQLKACEDYALWLRILSRHELLLPKNPLVIKYGGHKDQLSRQSGPLDYWRVKGLEEWLHAKGNDDDLNIYRGLVYLELAHRHHILLCGAEKHRPEMINTHKRLKHHALLNSQKILYKNTLNTMMFFAKFCEREKKTK